MTMNRAATGLSVIFLLIAASIMAGGICEGDPGAPYMSATHTVLACAPLSLPFGEVPLDGGAELVFTATNPSRVSFSAYSPDEYRDSRVKVSGFSTSDCGSGDPPFEVVGTLPLELSRDESAELRLRFEPASLGDFSCTLTPEFQMTQRYVSTSEDYYVVETHDCTLTASGTGIPWPEPACALDPGPTFDFGEVEAGDYKELTLTVSNQTPTSFPTNQFLYLLDNPSSDCRFFEIDPADTVGVIGPGGSKDIVVRFAPGAGGNYQCTRDLSSLQYPAVAGNPPITNPCPSTVTWAGTGLLGAATWAECSPSGFAGDLHAVSGLSATEVYAAGDGGQVVRTAGDCSWQAFGTGFDDVNLTDIWVHEEGGEKSLWAVGNIPPPPGLYGGTGAILRSEGGTWSKVDEDGRLTFDAVWGSGLNDVYFAGLGISSDFPNAKHWDGAEDQSGLLFSGLIISNFGMSEVTSLGGTGATDIWASLLQSYNSVYRFQGGDEWKDWTPTPPTKVLHDVWAVQGDGFYAVYAVGEDGAIYHHDGTEGSPWTDESIKGEDRDFYGVWVSRTGQVFVVGEGPVVYRGDVNNPTGWVAQSLPEGLPPGALMDVWGVTAGDVYAVGSNGLALHYRPEGYTPGG